MESLLKTRQGSKPSASPQMRSAQPAVHLGPESLKDGVVQLLLRQGRPVTRQNYLSLAGLQEPLDPEVEADIPRELQL
jgi:hypothetical protein